MTKITINNEEYELDFNKAMALGVLVRPFEPLKIGYKFTQDGGTGGTYILACPAQNQAVLINISSGFRISDKPIEVKDIFAISQAEWIAICNGFNFEKII